MNEGASGRKVWKKGNGTGEEIACLKVILIVLTESFCIIFVSGQLS